MHDVAGIHEAKTDAAADRRSDAGIGELELGVVNLALIRGNGPINLANQCALSIELLLGDDALLEGNADQLAVNAAADSNGVEGSDSAEAIEVNGQVAALCGGNHDRDYKPTCA